MMDDNMSRTDFLILTFDIQGNGFKGTLPENSVTSMSAVKAFMIASNSFEGPLPGIGLQAMRS
eukprot:2088910-Amphidinium_carterae.1